MDLEAVTRVSAEVVAFIVCTHKEVISFFELSNVNWICVSGIGLEGLLLEAVFSAEIGTISESVIGLYPRFNGLSFSGTRI